MFVDLLFPLVIEIEEKSSVSVGNRQKRILELYAASASHLALLAASYPADEAKWLVTTAFNRGVAHHRMSRFDHALNMFEASKNLLPHALRADPSLCDMQCRIEEARVEETAGLPPRKKR